MNGQWHFAIENPAIVECVFWQVVVFKNLAGVINYSPQSLDFDIALNDEVNQVLDMLDSFLFRAHR